MYEQDNGQNFLELLMSAVMFNVYPFSAWVRTVEEGAHAQVMAAVAPEYADMTGAYIYNDEAFFRPQAKGLKTHDPNITKEVWELSEKILRDRGHELTSKSKL
jgi:hypothetical protein